MAENEIRIGSYIHLENYAPNGGYLEVCGAVQEQDALRLASSDNVRRLVFTHENAKRDEGSGSWLVISAEGYSNNEPVHAGDKVFLWNPSGGYLGSFGNIAHRQLSQPDLIGQIQTGVFKTRTWEDLDPFKWTIHSATKSLGEPLVENDVLYLQNERSVNSESGYLDTGGLVTQHEQFKDYEGQRAFVFASTAADGEQGSDLWTVTLGRHPETAYYQMQFQPDASTGPWDSSSRLYIGGLSGLDEAILALKFNSDDGGKTLEGTVTYVEGKIVNASGTVTQIDGKPYNFEATLGDSWERYNYDVKIEVDRSTSEWLSVGRWHLGLRGARWINGARRNAAENIVAADISSSDNGHSLNGTMRYAGEDSLAPLQSKGQMKGQITLKAMIEKITYYGRQLRIEDDYGIRGDSSKSRPKRRPPLAWPVPGGTGPHIRPGGDPPIIRFR